MPVMVVIGEQTPPKSRAEMDVAELPGVQTRLLPGSLGLHEVPSCPGRSRLIFL